MSLRRSARIRNQDAPSPPEPPQSQPAAPVKKTKPKAPAAKPADTTKSKKKAEPVKAKGKNKAKQWPVHTQLSPANDKLSSLPPEVLNMVLQNIKHPPTLAKLGRTCKRYYALAMPQLYKRIAVAAMFHAHIPKLIRTLEPVLTIAQKKQLKKEGKYKGQQERFSSLLDEHAKPICADYVRNIVVGVCDPGRKHQYITDRYVEEAFKNPNNLEIIETSVLTESMAKSIASMKNLKALNLDTHKFEKDSMGPLDKLKNLQHLSVEDYNWSSGMGTNNVIRAILLNSRSTLRSFSMQTSSYSTDFLKDWEKLVKLISAAASSQAHDLTSLKSFSLSGPRFDEDDFLKSLTRAVDFIGLRELKLGRLSEGKDSFFNHLTSLTCSTPSKDISLRTLSIDMSDDSLMDTPEQTQAYYASKCAFISSFGTLSTLELKDHNQYPEAITVNPGMSDVMLQAILKHENLTTLRISYRGITSGLKIPYLSAETVAKIVNNLPPLEEFEFAPEEKEMDKIGEALSRGANLKSVICFPHEGWAGYPREDEPGFNVLRGILKGFLSRAGGDDKGKFVWEDHCNLKRVSVSYRTWDVASEFGKPQKGMKKAEKMESDGDGKRRVLYRDITGTFPRYIHVGYDPGFEWVEKVAKDME
ncbi:RNI [Fusarium albosuccineum]|uniref:RNI n=1 Tax=Fusarium albosuccineum TaxID=1237068 RepID=A0A8H4LBR4_9HYPO|nr:RNI [Fusarium albosuccineum]